MQMTTKKRSEQPLFQVTFDVLHENLQQGNGSLFCVFMAQDSI